VGNDRVKGLFERSQLDVLSIFASQASLILQNALLLSALRADKEKLVAELKDKRFGEIIGACPSMLEVFRKLQKVATTDISVLITGETGTGKELIAREIHRRSNRVNGPFIVINCGAIPENLIESELFGHVKGAFTGAIASRPGKFQAANGGTLFLDEIATMGSDTQAKILRVLQDRRFMHLGGISEIQVDVRIIAATNIDLRQAVRDGRFREDLFYRLNVITVDLPPLRARREDIPLLASHFLEFYANENALSPRKLSSDALRALVDYDWPGNVRELENSIERGVVLSNGPIIGSDLLPGHITGRSFQDALLEHNPNASLFDILEDIERRIIVEKLERCNGNQTDAAEQFHIPLSTLNQKIKRLNIEIRKKGRD
jgi:transcriptional regulator with PAS, ATPase and Fis domain